MHPDYPPRARIEWVIAGARVVLAVGSLFAIWLEPSTAHSKYEAAKYTLLAIYLVHSVATLALVWKPIEFARASGLAGHIFDLAAFAAIMFLTEGASSPFFVYFVFSVICGALRWESMGALLTAIGALSLYAGISGYEFFTNPAFQVDRFVIRIAQLTVVAALLMYLSSYFPRTLRELLRFASWPHVLPEDESHVVTEIIERADEVLPAPRILLVWQERDEEYVNLAWRGESGMEWIREPRNTYEPIVTSSLLSATFQARDVGDRTGRVDYWYKGRFREWTGAPIHESLRERFDMHAVQSSRIEGSVVEGRVFWLGRHRMRIDDLVVGDLVARLAGSRLESAYLVASLRETAALNERLRVARDLHDSVLQSLAGTGYQLAVASRVLNRDPEGARRKLQDAQSQLEQSEREMRAIISRLRPQPRDVSESFPESITSRLQALRRRIEEQWKVDLVLEVSAVVEDLPDELREQLLLIVQEAALNAAKHANATTIHASLDLDSHIVIAQITDDGKGFPFDGSYDLTALTTLELGPLTLKERVAELRGDLHIRSSPSGSTVRITLPLAQAALVSNGHLTRSR